MRCQYLRLLDKRGRAAFLNGPSLVDGNGAEVTLAVASPVAGEGKANGGQGRDRASLGIEGMQVPFKGQGMYGIQLLGAQRELRRIMDEKAAVLPLCQRLRGQRIVVCIKGRQTWR